jgi:hypothetical protein
MAGRISNKLIADIVEELDSGQQKRLFRKLRWRAELCARQAEKRAKANRDPETGMPYDAPKDDTGKQSGESADVTLGKAVLVQANVEETISRIRERYVKTDGVAHALLAAILDRGQQGQQQERPPIVVVFEREADPDPETK